jgi:hypothetical protein
MVERSFSSPRLSLLVHRSRLGQVDPSVLTQGIIDSPTVGPPEHVHPDAAPHRSPNGEGSPSAMAVCPQSGHASGRVIELAAIVGERPEHTVMTTPASDDTPMPAWWDEIRVGVAFLVAPAIVPLYLCMNPAGFGLPDVDAFIVALAAIFS